MSWEPAEFKIAVSYGGIWRTEPRAGYIYLGLGLHVVKPPSPKGRRPQTWGLTHLGSGHGICTIKGSVAEAFPIASEIAEAGDWGFDSLHGWKDRFPNVLEVVNVIFLKHGKRAARINSTIPANEDAARSIAMERA